MADVFYNYKDPLNATAAAILLVLGLFGVICNGSIVYIFYKAKSERTSFNLICVFRSLSNIYILSTTFLGLFLPATLIGSSPYSPPISSWLIHLSNTFYLGNEYQTILIALNRFFAMFFPIKYKKIFGIRLTLAILLGIYIYRFVFVILETILKNELTCYSFYSLSSLAWQYDPRDICKTEDNILTVISIRFMITTSINLATLAKFIHFYKSGHQANQETQRRIRRNVILFLQTMLQDSLYLIDLSFMFKLSQLSESRVWTYISGTFVWQCVHSVDGFIMIMFNERLSLLRRKIFSVPSTKVLPPKMTISAVSAMPMPPPPVG